MKLFMRVFPESDNTLKSITVGRKCNLYCTRKRLYYASVFCFGGVLRVFFCTLVNINIVNTYVINIFRPFFMGVSNVRKTFNFLHYIITIIHI